VRAPLRHRRAVLVRRSREQRGLDDPMRPGEPGNVPGERVVLDDAPALGPMDVDQGVVVLVDELGPALGLSARRGGGARGLDHRGGNPRADRPGDGPTARGDLAVVVEHGDLVAEERRRPGAGGRAQRLVPRWFQREFVTRERRPALCDLLGFSLGSGEPGQGVVGIAGVTATAGSRDLGDPCRAYRAAACAAPAPRRGRRAGAPGLCPARTRAYSVLCFRARPRVYSGMRTPLEELVPPMRTNSGHDR
jgi:hypothetical protein